jgi:hypothetical protein
MYDCMPLNVIQSHLDKARHLCKMTIILYLLKNLLIMFFSSRSRAPQFFKTLKVALPWGIFDALSDVVSESWGKNLGPRHSSSLYLFSNQLAF